MVHYGKFKSVLQYQEAELSKTFIAGLVGTTLCLVVYQTLCIVWVIFANNTVVLLGYYEISSSMVFSTLVIPFLYILCVSVLMLVTQFDSVCGFIKMVNKTMLRIGIFIFGIVILCFWSFLTLAELQGGYLTETEAFDKCQPLCFAQDCHYDRIVSSQKPINITNDVDKIDSFFNELWGYRQISVNTTQFESHWYTAEKISIYVDNEHSRIVRYVKGGGIMPNRTLFIQFTSDDYTINNIGHDHLFVYDDDTPIGITGSKMIITMMTEDILEILYSKNILVERNITTIAVTACSQGAHSAVQLGVLSKHVTHLVLDAPSVLTVGVEGLKNGCAETAAMFVIDGRYDHAWAVYSDATERDRYNALLNSVSSWPFDTDALIASILFKRKQILVHITDKDLWSNPLGVLASVLSVKKQVPISISKGLTLIIEKASYFDFSQHCSLHSKDERISNFLNTSWDDAQSLDTYEYDFSTRIIDEWYT